VTQKNKTFLVASKKLKCAFLVNRSLLIVLMLSPTVSYNLVTSFASKMPEKAVSDIRIVFSKDAVIVLTVYTVPLQKVSNNTVMPT